MCCAFRDTFRLTTFQLFTNLWPIITAIQYMQSINIFPVHPIEMKIIFIGLNAMQNITLIIIIFIEPSLRNPTHCRNVISNTTS